MRAVDSINDAIRGTIDKFRKRKTTHLEHQGTFELVELSKALSAEISAAAERVEKTLAVHHFLSNGYLPPTFGGWPIAPDLAVFLIDLVQVNHYDVIFEFGSGSSTVLIARAIKGCTPAVPEKRHFAFEHLDEYQRQTELDLAKYSLQDCTTLLNSPLVEHLFEGDRYFFYDCKDVLERVRARFESPQRHKILVLVDGPPGITCKRARYPALPLILEKFAGFDVDILLDDSHREEEAEVAMMWSRDLKSRQFNYRRTELAFEKGAVLFCIRAGET